MYIELHAHSAFSFLEGASVPEELAEVCAGHQMPAMALLDRDGAYGLPRFHLAMKRLGLKAHVGAEIASLLTYANVDKPLARVPLLCASRQGYQNLCRLITRTKLRAPKNPSALPRRTKSEEEIVLHSRATASVADLSEFATGLICLSGGDEGPLSHAAAWRRGAAFSKN